MEILNPIINYNQDKTNKQTYGFNEGGRTKVVEDGLYSYVKWSTEELMWRINFDSCRTFGKALTKRIKSATTGCFVTNWNFGKIRDVCYGLLTLLDLEHRERRLNGWCDDESNVIKSLIREFPDGFSWHQLLHFVKVFRLNISNICQMDQTLIGLLQLKALILTSNFINECYGSCLPSDLKYLELYNNNIKDLRELTAISHPTGLLYLGVGRNQLKTWESLESLTDFDHLFYLDLCDNDFLSLPECLDLLKKLRALHCLSLYGTPCSMTVSYMRMVQKEIPHLLQLDQVYLQSCVLDVVEQNKPDKSNKNKKKRHNEEPAKESEPRPSSKGKEDKKKKGPHQNEEEFNLTGELLVYCFKVFGVEEPKKEKGVKNLYFFELECPLLDPLLLQKEKENLGSHVSEISVYADGENKGQTQNDKITKPQTEIDKYATKKDKDGKRKSRTSKRTESQETKDKILDSESIKRKGSRMSDAKWKSQILDNLSEAFNKYEKTKQYLCPQKQPCEDRHKFNDLSQIKRKQVRKSCFSFKEENVGWERQDDNQSTEELNKESLKDVVKEQDYTKRMSDSVNPANKRYSQTPNERGGRTGSIVKEDVKNKNSTKIGKDNDDNDNERKDKRRSENQNRSSFTSKKSKDQDQGADANQDKLKPGAQRKLSKKEKDIGTSKLDVSSPQKQKAKKDKPIVRNSLTDELDIEYLQENLEYLIERDVEIEGSTKFMTKEIEWARVMEFKQPISIKTTDLLSLRDTFRTILTLRLIHVKIKAEKKKKGKNKTRQITDVPSEDMLLREKLAVIPVPLEMIIWNQKYLGYVWDIKQPCMAEKYPKVKDIKFAKKGKKNINNLKLNTAKEQLPEEPEILTVHLGVGVKRDIYP